MIFKKGDTFSFSGLIPLPLIDCEVTSHIRNEKGKLIDELLVHKDGSKLSFR